MNKKTFIKNLSMKLDNLDEKKLNRIIKKYEKTIDEEIALGKKEKDIISSFGDIDLIVKLYANEESIKNDEDDNNIGKNIDNENESSTTQIIDKILKYIDEAFKKIDGELAKRILLILCFFAVGITGLLILHVPFLLIDMAGGWIFSGIFDNYYFYHIVKTTWSLSINICYILLVLWIIIHYVNQIISHFTNKTEKKQKSIKPIVEENKSKQTIIKSNSPFDAVYLILKIFIIILTIPLMMVEAALILTLFFAVTLVVSGVSLFGPLIFLVGLIFLIATLLDLVYVSMSKGGIK